MNKVNKILKVFSKMVTKLEAHAEKVDKKVEANCESISKLNDKNGELIAEANLARSASYNIRKLLEE